MNFPATWKCLKTLASGMSSHFAMVFGTLAMLLAIANSVAAQGNEIVLNEEKSAKHRYWTTNWSFDSIDIGQLLGRLRQFGIDVPVDAEGDVTLDFAVSIPLNGLTDAAAYRFDGTFSSSRLRLEQLVLADLTTDVRYESGVLSLNNLSTRWIDLRREPVGTSAGQSGVEAGTLAGEASMELVPRGVFSASLNANRLELSPLYDLVLAATENRDAVPLGGQIGGSLDVRVPLKTIRELKFWTIQADLRASYVTIDDSVPLSLATGVVKLFDGQLSADDVRIMSPIDPAVRLIASVRASLRGSRPFEIDVRGNDLPIDSLAKLAALGTNSLAGGKLDIDARGTGELGAVGGTARWDFHGRLASPELSAMGVQLGLIEHQFQFDATHIAMTRLNDAPSSRIVIERLKANYVIDRDQINLSELDAAIFGGSVSGSAMIARGAVGTHHVSLNWQQLRPRLNTAGVLPVSVDLSLATSGEVEWSVPADSVDQLATHQGTARIAIDPIQMGSSKIGRAKLALQAVGGQIVLQGTGELFGGSFQVDTTTKVANNARWRDLNLSSSLISTRGTFDVNRVRLSDASSVLLLSNRRRINGVVSAAGDFALSGGESALVKLSTKVALEHLSIDGTLLTRGIISEVDLDERGLTIKSLRGVYAGGRIEALGNIALPSGEGRLQVRLAAIDASAGLLPISTSAAGWAEGSLSGRLTIETGRQFKARGAIEVRECKLFSIPAGTAHGSLVASAQNDFSRWSLDLNSIESSIGRGSILGDAGFRSSSIRPGAFDLASQWQARRVDFGQLLHDAAGTGSSYASGNLSGNLTLNGTGIRTSADLAGRFDAKLAGTQARAVPGLVFAQSYLGAFSLAGTRFDEGRLSGSISSGAARIDEFWLHSDQMRVYADGRVQIPSGRMDVEAVISTGNFDANSVALDALVSQVTVGASLPIAAIIQINQLISDQTLYVDVLGPITDPRLRLKPLASLREGAAKFFLREALSTVAPVAVGGGVLARDSMQ